jgi:hypothetical protein
MTDTQSYEFTPEQIAEQKQQLRAEGIAVAEMVEVDRRFYTQATAVFVDTHEFTTGIETNGYFAPPTDNQELRFQLATKSFPKSVTFGTENEDDSRDPKIFTAVSINSNASVAHGRGTCDFDAEVRAGMVAGEANKGQDIPVVGGVIIYDENTACNALAAQTEVLDAAGVQTAYSKGATYNPYEKGKTPTVEHRFVRQAYGMPWIVSPLIGDATPTYSQQGDDPELEAALAGVNYDSLRFLVTQELYDLTLAQQTR